MPRSCPKCGSERIHRSHRRGAVERCLSLCGLRARRCHECNTRSVSVGNSVILRSDVDVLLRKISIVVLAAVAVLAVVMGVLWFSRRDATPPTARLDAARWCPRRASGLMTPRQPNTRTNYALYRSWKWGAPVAGRCRRRYRSVVLRPEDLLVFPEELRRA